MGVCDSAWAISGAPVSVLCTCVWLFPLGYDVTRYLLCFHSDVRLSGGLLFSGFDVATRRALVIARLPNVAAGGWGRQTVGSETAGRLNGSAISPGERVRAIRFFLQYAGRGSWREDFRDKPTFPEVELTPACVPGPVAAGGAGAGVGASAGAGSGDGAINAGDETTSAADSCLPPRTSLPNRPAASAGGQARQAQAACLKSTVCRCKDCVRSMAAVRQSREQQTVGPGGSCLKSSACRCHQCVLSQARAATIVPGRFSGYAPSLPKPSFSTSTAVSAVVLEAVSTGKFGGTVHSTSGRVAEGTRGSSARSNPAGMAALASKPAHPVPASNLRSQVHRREAGFWQRLNGQTTAAATASASHVDGMGVKDAQPASAAVAEPAVAAPAQLKPPTRQRKLRKGGKLHWKNAPANIWGGSEADHGAAPDRGPSQAADTITIPASTFWEVRVFLRCQQPDLSPHYAALVGAGYTTLKSLAALANMKLWPEDEGQQHIDVPERIAAIPVEHRKALKRACVALRESGSSWSSLGAKVV